MFASADQTEQTHGSEIEFYITGIQNDHISNKCTKLCEFKLIEAATKNCDLLLILVVAAVKRGI